MIVEVAFPNGDFVHRADFSTTPTFQILRRSLVEAKVRGAWRAKLVVGDQALRDEDALLCSSDEAIVNVQFINVPFKRQK